MNELTPSSGNSNNNTTDRSRSALNSNNNNTSNSNRRRRNRNKKQPPKRKQQQQGDAVITPNDAAEQQQPSSAKTSKSSHHRGNKHDTKFPWRKHIPADAVDPITLDPLNSLKYPPFESVFLLAGQSNMVGRCDSTDLPSNHFSIIQQQDDSTHDNRIFFTLHWDNDSNFGKAKASHSSGEWRPLQCQYSPGMKRALFGPEMGLAETLGRRLVQQQINEHGRTGFTRQRIHFLKFAMGSTNLHSSWNPNNTDDDHPNRKQRAYFRRFIEFCQLALVEDGTAPPKKLVSMFWLQGESDSFKARDAKSYLCNLQAFFNAVRSELNAPSLPIVVSPVVWKSENVDIVNRALKSAGNGAVSNCVCINPLDARFGVQEDGDPSCVSPDHLTSEGVLDIGRRMGDAFPIDQIR